MEFQSAMVAAIFVHVYLAISVNAFEACLKRYHTNGTLLHWIDIRMHSVFITLEWHNIVRPTDRPSGMYYAYCFIGVEPANAHTMSAHSKIHLGDIISWFMQYLTWFTHTYYYIARTHSDIYVFWDGWCLWWGEKWYDMSLSPMQPK